MSNLERTAESCSWVRASILREIEYEGGRVSDRRKGSYSERLSDRVRERTAESCSWVRANILREIGCVTVGVIWDMRD